METETERKRKIRGGGETDGDMGGREGRRDGGREIGVIY